MPYKIPQPRFHSKPRFRHSRLLAQQRDGIPWWLNEDGSIWEDENGNGILLEDGQNGENGGNGDGNGNGEEELEPFSVLQAQLGRAVIVDYDANEVVLGDEIIAGDTFDGYAPGPAFEQPLIGGNGFVDGWIVKPNYTGVIADDTFDAYSPGQSTLNAGNGWAGDWIRKENQSTVFGDEMEYEPGNL